MALEFFPTPIAPLAMASVVGIAAGDTLLEPAGSEVYGKIVQHESGAAGFPLTHMLVTGERASIRTELRPRPEAGKSLGKVEFRVEHPFTVRVAAAR